MLPKTCSKCGVPKALDEFYKQRGYWMAHCKSCHNLACKIRQENNPQQYMQYKRNHKKKLKERAEILLPKTKECSRCHEVKSFKEFSKSVHATPGIIPHCKACDSIASKEWRINNPEKNRLKSKAWAEKFAAAPGEKPLRVPPGVPCGYCGENMATWYDHKVALEVGGTNDPENLIPSCPQCNSSKGELTPEEWTAWKAKFKTPA